MPSETVVSSFPGLIRSMNAMYKLPIHDVPTLPDDVSVRISKFKSILSKEISEADDIIGLVDDCQSPLDVMVAIADLLGDIVVYCRSEALKYGIPLEEVLEIIMESNESKLDNDGNPIYDEDGKFCKGPNTWKPEARIAELLKSKGLFAVTANSFDVDRLTHEAKVAEQKSVEQQ